MQTKLAVFAISVLLIGLGSSAYAHKSQVIGEYKIEAGWVNEPPVTDKPNAIEIIIVKATASDMNMSEEEHAKHQEEHTEVEHKDHDKKAKKTQKQGGSTKTKTKAEHKDHDKKAKKTQKQGGSTSKKIKNGIGGLSKDLEADVTLNGVKTMLPLTEDTKNKGRYYSKYTPDSAGFPTIHIVGKIKNTPIEVTFHPEKVKPKE